MQRSTTKATITGAGTPESGALFGSSVSAADINGDGYRDLAIGVYGEKISQETTEGGVHVLLRQRERDHRHRLPVARPQHRRRPRRRRRERLLRGAGPPP
ncbi:FG-GAP repeat protein [Streptomyces sp. NPDC001920]